MPFGLPAIGEGTWGQKILDSINAVKATADAAQVAADLEADVAATVGTDGALDTALSATIDARSNAVNAIAEGVVVGDGVADDTAAIQALLDDPSYKRVYLPAAAYNVTALNVPAGKELFGEFTRAYTTTPTNGTRLVCTNAAQTTPLITTQGRCRVEGLAVVGAGAGALHDGIKVGSSGAILRDLTVTDCNVGINGNYLLARLHNVAVYGNASHGVQNLLDGGVYGCTINANGGNGLDAQTGANGLTIVGNRIEWNDGHGINLFGSTQNTVVGNMLDRNGKAGLAMQGCEAVTVTGNNLWRNGRLSSGTAADDVNIRLQTNDRCVVVGNTTQTGEDDGGGGYLSPAVALRTQSNTDCIIALNDLKGGTTTSVTTVVASTGGKRFGNLLLTGESETFLGLQYLTTSTATAATTATATFEIPGVSVGTFSVSQAYDVTLVGRYSGTGSDQLATAKLLVQREGGAASVSVLGLTNVSGTQFATTGGDYTVTATVNSDGTTITLSIQNNLAASATFRVNVR